MSTPRPHQQDVLAYDEGTVGVSAVPGSGKTWTLTRLAARIVAQGGLGPHQEVLVVTLTNASTDNFSSRIGELVQEQGLLPEVGYRVCTLHTLAHEIVRARPDLVGLTEDFHVIDQRAAGQILSDIAQSWLRSRSAIRKEYLSGEISGHWRKRVLSQYLPGQIKGIAQNAIKHAKSHGLSAEELKERIAQKQGLLLAEMTQAIYSGYQEALKVQSAVDFDDLIRFALQTLEIDGDLTARLRDQWPYVLEDEAQDSSKLQERILRRIVGEDGNWVRVGDPNQAIYESFTTADPQLLRRFLVEAEVSRSLPASGRSQPSIIKLANEVIRWSREEHPVREVRTALAPPLIQPTPEGDPQPNPPNRPDRVAFVDQDFSEEQEIDLVVRSLKKWVEAYPDKTAAVLAPTGKLGSQVVERLAKEGVPYTDSLLKITTETRKAARQIERTIEYLAKPTSSARLAKCFQQWRFARAEEPNGKEIKRLAGLLAECDRVESYLWPQAGQSWLERPDTAARLKNEDREQLETFRAKARYWLDLSSLPIGELVMAVAQDLFSDPDRLALAQMFAGLLRRASSYNPDWGLPQFSDELRVIAKNQRKFEGARGADSDFNPDAHSGKVAVSTMHGAKGLEWDRVHLLAVNEYHFPAAQPGDSYMPEKWYVRDELNLEAEALAQIDAVASEEPYLEGEATREARREYARERIRLFYVGVTRAREELMVTTNVGREDRNHDDNGPALIFEHMKAFYDEQLNPSRLVSA